MMTMRLMGRIDGGIDSNNSVTVWIESEADAYSDAARRTARIEVITKGRAAVVNVPVRDLEELARSILGFA